MASESFILGAFLGFIGVIIVLAEPCAERVWPVTAGRMARTPCAYIAVGIDDVKDTLTRLIARQLIRPVPRLALPSCSPQDDLDGASAWKTLLISGERAQPARGTATVSPMRGTRPYFTKPGVGQLIGWACAAVGLVGLVVTFVVFASLMGR